ncbi:hypothetical protein QYF61_019310 [Mycteria americana]|uniref:Uncharacterized protein n=1 Tax=Mycteria americana TaxID=33587 RepID=A0AAN7NB49_MYCAM|nr:hypothetical protein QYF61_019310 [Mycteria americana]
MAVLRCLLLLLCGAALGPAVHLDFAEHRSQAAKIKVNPRGNLWATGTGVGGRGHGHACRGAAVGRGLPGSALTFCLPLPRGCLWGAPRFPRRPVKQSGMLGGLPSPAPARPVMDRRTKAGVRQRPPWRGIFADTEVCCIAGHFMGKKSVTGSPHLESPEEPAVPIVFSPSLRALLEDMMELLTRELLKILLQERLLDENQGKYDLTDQREAKRETAPYVKGKEAVLQRDLGLPMPLSWHLFLADMRCWSSMAENSSRAAGTKPATGLDESTPATGPSTWDSIRGRPLPPGGNLYPFWVFSSQNLLHKLVQGGGTDEGVTSLQHALREQLQPGHAAGVEGSNLLQDMDANAMGREGLRELPAGQEDSWEYISGTWAKVDSVPLAWEHPDGSTRPQSPCPFMKGQLPSFLTCHVPFLWKAAVAELQHWDQDSLEGALGVCETGEKGWTCSPSSRLGNPSKGHDA